MFAPLFTATKQVLSTEPLLPRFDTGHVSAEHARLARTQELRALFSPAQLSALFAEKHELHWLSGDITQDRAPELRRYLMQELAIAEITPELIIVPIRLMQVATECSLYVRSKGVLFPPLRIGRETGHERLVDVPRALPRRGIVHPGLGGSTLAVWVCVRPLRAPAGLV